MSGTDYTTTPNLGLYKPNYDMDDEQWGAHLNLNADMLDAYLSPGISSVFVPITGGTMTGSGRLALSGDPIGPLDAVTKQYLDSHTGTGSQIYLGGWDPVANNPTLASGALANGVLTPKGSYYLATVGGTSVAIDGLTTWLAGDYITSNGTVWQRVQASSSPYLPLAGGTVSGSLTVAGTFTHGSNTATQRLLNINAAANVNKNIQFQSAGLNRWILRSDQSSGDDLVIQGCNDAGAAIGTLLQFDRVYGAQKFSPYPVVFSGADGGTPAGPGATIGSMTYSMNSSYSGATSFSGGIVFNRWWVTGDTVTDNDQGVYYLFQGDYGPATTGGGRTGLQITLRSVGDITSGNAVVLNGFRSTVQGLHSGGMTPAWNGGNVQAMDLMSQIVDGATGWGATNIIQANNNISGVGQNNFIRRTGLYLACGLDAGTQGGRLDAVICTSINPVHNPTGGYPAPGQGYRYYLGIGNGGSSSFTVDAYNGEIIGTIPAISTPNNQLVAMPTQSCLHGTNFSKINFVENAFWSPGFKVRGDGTTRIARMQVSAGTTGPVIDAPLQVATITAVTSSTSGFGAGLGAYVGEQCYDHLGGIAAVDTVSVTGAVLTAHYLYPPNVAPGEVITVASGVVAAQASSGATVVHLRAGTYGGAAGDAVATAKAVAGVPGGTTVVSFVASQTDCVVTLSLPLTANLAVGTMLLFTQTMPATTVTFRTGSEATWSASVTWAAATEIALGSAGVTTRVAGPATVGGTFGVTGNSTMTGSLILGLSATPGFLRVQGSAGTSRVMQFTTNNLARWTLQATNTAESGNNTGSWLQLDAYSDSPATFLGSLLQAQRTSGALGVGPPHFTQLAAFTQSVPRVAVPGASIGNYTNFLSAGDTQATYTLGTNPLSVTSGSPTVTVTWTGCGVANGLINKAGWEVWVNLLGATAVGGITPTGWLKVAAFPDNDHLTVTWTSNATSTATGGGSAVTVQPSFSTVVNQVTSTTRYGGGGFVNQATELWEVNPYFLPLTGAASPRYLQRWHWTCGPPCDAAHNFALAGVEWDLTNRGPDRGYQPDPGGALNNTTGILMGATTMPPWASGVGTATNWHTVYGVYGVQGQVGSYIGFTVMPDALVGAARDPTGHGGVGVDIFGSYVNLPGAPFTTAIGTSTVTVNIGPGALSVQNNGDSVWLPNVVTVAGVTFGGASYTMAGVDKANGKFTITGTGSASGVASGGGSGQWLAFATLVPYAPYQAWGSFKHGLISTNAHFESGGIIETQPGNGILWSDGTGTASVNGIAGTAGNVGVRIATAGTGAVIFGTLPVNAANDAGAATANVPVGGIYRNGSVLQVRVA